MPAIAVFTIISGEDTQTLLAGKNILELYAFSFGGMQKLCDFPWLPSLRSIFGSSTLCEPPGETFTTLYKCITSENCVNSN